MRKLATRTGCRAGGESSGLLYRPISYAEPRIATRLSHDFSDVRAYGGGEETPLSADDARSATPGPPKSASCDRPLTWADFPGPAPDKHDALTKWDLNLDGGKIRVSLSKKSGVRDRARNPSDRALNGCGEKVTACEQWLQANPGGWYSLGPVTGCAAAHSPNTPTKVTSISECQSVIGTECDQVAQLRSDCLLRHEQYHWNLACLFTAKGNAAIAAGANTAAVFTWVAARTNSLTKKYDKESNHGGEAGAQAAWESAIDGGMPDEKFTPARKAPKSPPGKKK